MATPRKLPIHKRFPNQWSTKSVVYTPQTRLEIEGPLSEEVGMLVLALLTSVKKAKDPTILADMKALTDKLLPKEAGRG